MDDLETYTGDGGMPALIDFLKAHHGYSLVPAVDPRDGRLAPAIVIPAGLKLESLKPLLDQWAPKPDRRAGEVKVSDMGSMIRVIERFRNDLSTAIFAQAPNVNTDHLGRFAAVFDWHQGGADDVAAARFGRHRASYESVLSDEYKAWQAAFNRRDPFNQVELAAFIEDRIADIAPAPDAENPADAPMIAIGQLLRGTFGGPERLMDTARNFAVHSNEKAKAAINLATGEASISYENDQSGTLVKAPSLFCIAIPLAYRGDAFRIAVRLRYSAGGGTVSWRLAPYRLDVVVETVFESMVQQLRETALPVLRAPIPAA